MGLKGATPRMRELNTVDLFCGAGGASTGLELALSRLKMCHKGLAINHWAVAVDTMKRNHPDIDTKQMSIEEAVPADLVPGGTVDLLWASPSCTHHSRAKGGKPRDNQLRAQPELVLTWLDQLRVRRIIIENVPEFVQWAPLGFDKKPLKSKITWMDARDVYCASSGQVKVGSSFAAWVASIKARNYDVEWKIINCADYGDATSRRRFFLKAVRKGCGKIRWPEPTHAEDPQPDLFGRELKPWRGVRECLDLEDLGRSIFEPGRNLTMNTLRRVDVGMQKFNGISFLMDMLGSNEGGERRVHPLSDPMPTQHASGNRFAVVRSFIVKMNNNASAEDIDKPLSTVLAGGQHHALCTPFIVRANKGCFAESIDKPLSSQQAHTVHHALCHPLIIDHFKNGEAHSVDEPLGAQTTHDRYSVATPLILGQNGGAQALPIDRPCPTIATKGAIRLATPVIVDMSHPAGNDSGHIGSADKPIRTITTFDNIQIATPVIIDDVDVSHLPQLPDGRYLDIRLRMLKPSELAAAHSFPTDYILTGNRTEQVKQIGNSVPVMTAAAMCEVDFREVS